MLGLLVLGFNLWVLKLKFQGNNHVSSVFIVGTIFFLLAFGFAESPGLRAIAVVGFLVDIVALTVATKLSQILWVKQQASMPEFFGLLRQDLLNDISRMKGLPEIEAVAFSEDHQEFQYLMKNRPSFRWAREWLDDYFDSWQEQFEGFQGISMDQAKQLYPQKCIELLVSAGVPHEEAEKDFDLYRLD